ncbi:hypothetical protein ILUMI_24602 [Ignelater luminosus]|uniref:Uncharacterized protein n=1 Tax=Ignelater luminosus TaxID=2038154 RepID=A0A8K0CA62_IGNLU|nr:hypothetical protein ILUMI_24602 [Ignelater luminosus]
MNDILCLILVCAISQVRCLEILDYPDITNVDCLSREDAAHILEYNKLEIINNLQKFSLADLLTHRGITVDNNTKYNQFLYCVWKKENYLTANGDINFIKLQQIVKDAIVEVVGRTGPAINLSMAFTADIINECKSIIEFRIEDKIIKIQNHIVVKLQPFSKI